MKKYIIFVALFNLFCHQNPSTATESCVILPLSLIRQTEQVKQPTADGGFIFSDMKKEPLICKICEKKFHGNGRHLKKVHGITSQEYYFKYISSDNKCAAPDCDNATKFNTITTGWRAYCSLACCYKKGTERNLKCAKSRKGKTFVEMYGQEEADKKKQKMRERNKSEKFQEMMRSEEYREKVRRSKLNVRRPQILIDKLKAFHKGKSKGDKNNNWKGGVTAVDRLIGACLENGAWKRNLFIENNKCFICGSEKDCEAHHLEALSVLIRRHGMNKENWRDFSNILFDLKNGIVLCNAHHNSNLPGSFHQVFGRIDITTEQFIYYLLWLDMPEKVDEFCEKYFNQEDNL